MIQIDKSRKPHQTKKSTQSGSAGAKRWAWLARVLAILAILGFYVNQPTRVHALDWFKESMGVKEDDQLTKQDLQTLQEVYQTIQRYYIEEVDKETLMQGALKGMVQALEEPYSEYLSPEQSQAFDDTVEGSFTGIGVQFMMKDNQATVIAPIDGTPAAKAGIQANDIFVSVDGEPLDGMTSNEVVQLIRGPEGSKVTLEVQRGDSRFEVELTRAEIPITTVTSELDPDHPEVGYLKLTQFASTTYDELVEAITDLRAKGAKRFIFDVRYNPGGLLTAALSISNMFLSDGQVIMQTVEKDKKPQEYQATDANLGDFQVDEPYVVLVDEGSASASEILAAAIQENTDAMIVGSKTFGKGTVQNLTTFSEYGELKLTIAKWLTPKGNWIHDKGLEPDVKVDMPALATAIRLNPEETLKAGDASEFVRSASLMLDALGYDLAETTYFNDQMTQAVKDFQKDHDLEVTGDIHSTTAEELMTLSRDYLQENDPQYAKALDVVLNQ